MVNYNKYFKEAPLSKEWERATFELNPNEISNQTSFALGQIVPLYAPLEVLPHDTWVFDLASLIRMPDPFIAPILDGLDFDVYAFYCPKRLLWNFTKEFYGQSSDAGPAGEVLEPRLSIDQFAVDPDDDTQYVSGSTYQLSLASHLGIPFVPFGSAIDNADKNYTYVNILPLRMYFMIYNYYFRDQNVMDEYAINFDDFGDSNDASDSTILLSDQDPITLDYNNFGAGSPLLRACKKQDYFTSMLPYAEKTGTDILIPMAGQAPIYLELDHDLQNNGYKLLGFTPTSIDARDKNVLGGKNSRGVVFDIVTETQDGDTYVPPDTTSSLYADLAAATAASINLLRESLALYRLYQVDAIGGTRYDEQIFSHFGCRPNAETFKPELLGEAHFKLNIDQVVSHAGNDVESLGETAGYSVTGNKTHLVTKSFTEPGYIMILGVARQSYHIYPSGLAPLWSKHRRFDYFYSEFKNLGLVPNERRQIYAGNKFVDNDVFGFNDYGNDNRHFQPMVTGALNPNISGSLDHYSLADETSDDVALDPTFLLEDGTNLARCIASGELFNQFVARFALKGTMTRVVPVTSIPKGLI